MNYKNIYLHYKGTLKHKAWVFLYTSQFALKLFWRGIIHDLSKFRWSEAEGFVRVIDQMPKHEFGSEEYKRCLRAIKPSIDLHYSRNSHHPEFYTDKISGMSIIDVAEMFADWRAASKRNKNPNLDRSLDSLQVRYGFSGIFKKMAKNSMK